MLWLRGWPLFPYSHRLWSSLPLLSPSVHVLQAAPGGSHVDRKLREGPCQQSSEWEITSLSSTPDTQSHSEIKCVSWRQHFSVDSSRAYSQQNSQAVFTHAAVKCNCSIVQMSQWEAGPVELTRQNVPLPIGLRAEHRRRKTTQRISRVWGWNITQENTSCFFYDTAGYQAFLTPAAIPCTF